MTEHDDLMNENNASVTATPAWFAVSVLGVQQKGSTTQAINQICFFRAFSKAEAIGHAAMSLSDDLRDISVRYLAAPCPTNEVP